MSLSESSRAAIREKLEFLYGERVDEGLLQIEQLAERHASPMVDGPPPELTQRDIVLITYGDQIQSEQCSPLRVLDRFLRSWGLEESLRIVHILPFYPYSSDDGFSVIDYRQVDPLLGDWDDIAALRESFDLMFDLVLNHCSQQSRYFQKFLEGVPPYDEFFHDVDPAEDLSQVTRPRSHPLLTPYETARGQRHVWTTFSADQVDLNFGSPDVLVELLDVLLFYISHGARIIRLDAIAYLWKRIGTTCIHLPETHAVVKLMRDLVDSVAPGTILLTETNVPHAENVSYFGDGDEAHLVYQFSLAPLLLDAFLTGDVGPLKNWLTDLEPARPGTAYFNFTASHDGVGVRPLEGLVSPERLEGLVQAVRDRGGHVSMRKNPDGSESPYELNITWFSALADPDEPDAELQIRRFISSQAIMLALAGVPAVYFHSLIGTPNDTEGVARTGRARSINRRRFQHDELDELLTLPSEESEPSGNGTEREVFDRYRELLRVRTALTAFHPDGPQTILSTPDERLLVFRRESPDVTQTIDVVLNVTPEAVEIPLSDLDRSGEVVDLLSGQRSADGEFRVEPYGCAWLNRGDGTIA